MHELGIASAILETVRAESEKHGEARATRVAVRVGELSAVDPEALRFDFDAMIRDTPLSGLALEIQVCPLRYRCRACGLGFASPEFISDCPSCGAAGGECAGGDELDLAFLEMEDEPNRDRTKSAE